MPKEIPILFSTPMVQAILEGRKTETRRELKPQPIDNREIDGNFFEGNHKGYVKVDGHANWHEQFAREFAKWQPGDVLWVRESWNITDPDEAIEGEVLGPRTYYEGIKAGNPILWQYVYKASSPGEHPIHGKARWKPSIHMPKEAARIWLEVVEVKVERLQAITEDSARAEGILYYKEDGRIRYKDYMTDARGYGHPDHDYPSVGLPVTSFCTLWEKINGLNSWIANPWVWVIKFKVLSTTGKPSPDPLKGRTNAREPNLTT